MVRRQPKGIPTGGEFAKNEHGEAGEDLAHTGTSESDSVLESWGLTESDVPGFTAAWDERSALIAEHIPSVRDAVEEEFDLSSTYASEDGVSIESVHAYDHEKYVSIEVVTRESNTDDDDLDDYDRSSSFTLRASGDSADRIRVALGAVPRLRAQSAARAEREALIEGSIPPWHITADREELRQSVEALRASSRASSNAGTHIQQADTFDATLSDAKSMSLEIDDKDSVPRQAYGVNLASPMFSRTESLRKSDLVSALVDVRTATQEKERMESARSAAEALPDGELRSWLLDDIPERTYRTVEGSGRRARMVSRKYTPKTPLLSAISDAERRYENAMKYSQPKIDQAEALGEEHAQRRSAARAAQEEHRANIEAHWRIGWAGAGDPPAPRVSTRDEWS